MFSEACLAQMLCAAAALPMADALPRSTPGDHHRWQEEQEMEEEEEAAAAGQEGVAVV